MIILKGIKCKYLESVEVELPRANMVIDPRPNDPHGFNVPRFQCDYHDNGTTVTLTRTDNNDTWDNSFSFRVYDPATETVPSFDSTIYTYMGEDDETAPHDTTVLMIHPSVTVIKEYAFSGYEDIKKCIMHDGVHTIEGLAFEDCVDMKTILLSRSLKHIGEYAFSRCSSLEAVFLPPTVNEIEAFAFEGCEELCILPLPVNISLSRIGERIVEGSDNFFDTTQILAYDNFDYDNDNDNDNEDEMFDDRVHQEIIDFYQIRVPPLHKASLDANVTSQTIQQCINTHGQATASIRDHDGMTPLHILAMNPHANISTIFACFHVNVESVFVEDSRGNTPLDYLRVHHDSIMDHTSLVSYLCMHRDATNELIL